MIDISWFFLNPCYMQHVCRHDIHTDVQDENFDVARSRSQDCTIDWSGESHVFTMWGKWSPIDVAPRRLHANLWVGTHLLQPVIIKLKRNPSFDYMLYKYDKEPFRRRQRQQQSLVCNLTQHEQNLVNTYRHCKQIYCLYTQVSRRSSSALMAELCLYCITLTGLHHSFLDSHRSPESSPNWIGTGPCSWRFLVGLIAIGSASQGPGGWSWFCSTSSGTCLLPCVQSTSSMH